MKKADLKIEYLDIKSLTPYENNTRKHEELDVENIAKSIKKYGMNDAVGIWGDNNVIVEGHGRVLACEKLGIDKIPVVRLDHLTDKQRKEYAIAHNATAELSNWDFQVLDAELQELDLADFDFPFAEKTDIDIDSFFEDAPKKEKEPKMVTCPCCGEVFEL